MSIWKHDIDIDILNSFSSNTLVGHLGIEFTKWGEDFLIAKMPVDARTKQPMGLLHGGASVALAETMGSVASTLYIDMSKQSAVGLEINANHLRAVKGGYVYGTCKPIKLGRTIHVWEIRIHNEDDKLICISRLTMAIIDNRTT